MDATRLRAWWWHRQGLDTSLQGTSAAEVLARTGWARSVASSGPYLTFFSRAGLAREAVDQAVARTEIHELPSARGCTYVVPADDYALALTMAQQFAGAEMKQAQKLGVTDKEIDKLCDAIVKALRSGPLDPEQIRQATGSASRNLGAEGKTKGLTTTLPIALGKLQVAGEIRRVPTNGRLDQQRYRYAAWTPSPLAKSKLEPDEAATELGRRYFRWIAPATLAEFQWFSGFGVKAAKQALGPLKLVPIEPGTDRLILPEDLDQFHSFKSPKDLTYALVTSLDAFFLMRRDLASLIDPADAQRSVMTDSGPKHLGGLTDLPSHGILQNGRLVGLWEFDTERSAIIWASFGASDKKLQDAVAETEAYVRDQLGDARSFSLDSPKSRAPRIEALRKAAGK